MKTCASMCASSGCHKFEQFIDEYLAAAGIREDGKTPLFRSAIGKTGGDIHQSMSAFLYVEDAVSTYERALAAGAVAFYACGHAVWRPARRGA
jgi:hypothetical protein